MYFLRDLICTDSCIDFLRDIRGCLNIIWICLRINL